MLLDRTIPLILKRDKQSLEYVDQYVQDEGDYVTVVLPEFVSAKWWHHLLHNQTGMGLKLALLYSRQNWKGRFHIITDVPFYLAR